MCKCNCDPCSSCGVRPNQLALNDIGGLIGPLATTFDLAAYGETTEEPSNNPNAPGDITISVGFGHPPPLDDPTSGWANLNGAYNNICGAAYGLQAQNPYVLGTGPSAFTVYGLAEIDRHTEPSGESALIFTSLQIDVTTGQSRFGGDPASRQYFARVAAIFIFYNWDPNGGINTLEQYNRFELYSYELASPCRGFSGIRTANNPHPTPTVTTDPVPAIRKVNLDWSDYENTSPQFSVDLIFP